MKIGIVFTVLICILLLFLIIGEKIALNLFRQGLTDLSETLLVNASHGDSVRIANLQKSMVYAFRRKRLSKNELNALDVLADSAMSDSVITDEEREDLLQFMEMLVVD